MHYAEMAKNTIRTQGWSDNPLERASQPVKDLLQRDYCIDVHTHLFDIKCINKSYFILRMLKDIVGLKSAGNEFADVSEEKAYELISRNEDGWEEEFMSALEASENLVAIETTKGIIDIIRARKFLGLKKMSAVYDHYLDKFSLGAILNKDVLVTALMMDLETGWHCRLKKNFYQQITELKALMTEAPVLPFLACDSRRADLPSGTENLYAAFNFAFSAPNSFFGVKIYPALGYDPSDHRLWPIYELCEKYNIPVLTHCGGGTISTDRNPVTIFEGDTEKLLSGKNRREVAYMLNDPARWALVLEKFPKLKLNFAHFGGTETWQQPSPVSHNGQQRKETIFHFMDQYENVYADFSYQLVDINISKNLREVLTVKENIRERTLFGTDFWVVNTQGNLLHEQKQFLEIIDNNAQGLPLSKLLTIDNPKKYLFGA